MVFVLPFIWSTRICTYSQGLGVIGLGGLAVDQNWTKKLVAPLLGVGGHRI